MRSCVTLETRKKTLYLDRTHIVGVVNVTPDSFSDGGIFFDKEAAIAHAFELERQGADILDIGGESTRPGSPRISAQEELDRVLPVIEGISRIVQIPISIDTYKSQVAREALRAGADIVNDVSALRADWEMVRVIASEKVPVVLMHALWPPETMQDDPTYVDVVEDVADFLESRARFAISHGIPREHIVLDPGIGFGKTLQHNLALMANLGRLLATGHPVLVGPSRKRFVGSLIDRDVTQRGWGTAGAVAVAAASGAHFVRVHDVSQMRDVVRVVDAIVWNV